MPQPVSTPSKITMAALVCAGFLLAGCATDSSDQLTSAHATAHAGSVSAEPPGPAPTETRDAGSSPADSEGTRELPQGDVPAAPDAALGDISGPGDPGSNDAGPPLDSGVTTDGGPTPDSAAETDLGPAADVPPAPAGSGWIGHACGDADPCAVADGYCATDAQGWPDGHCTQACDLYCPDKEGEPMTFCVAARTGFGGVCVSRCDFGYYGPTGCRVGYVCTNQPRHTQPNAQQLVCVPDDWADEAPCADPTNLIGDDDCYFALVGFGDPELEEAARDLAAGVADALTAETFLDLQWARSQEFVLGELGVSTIHSNYSAGHYADDPMDGMVVHYTTGQVEDSTIKYFSGSGPHASTHFIVGSYRNGLIVQLFSHRDRTWHAGTAYNRDHFGFDFANAGYLTDLDGGGFEDYYGKDYDLVLPLHGTDAVYVPDGIPGAASKYAARDYWQPYTYYQVVSFILVGRALHLLYGLDSDKIVRHGDISDSRVDPGPNFPFTAAVPLAFTADDVMTVPWLNAFKAEPDWITEHPEAR